MNLEKEILEMKQSHARMEAAVGRIESAIAGDPRFGTKGIMQEQKEQAAKIIDLQEFRDKQKLRDAKIAGGIFGVGAILEGFWHWINSK